MASHNEATAKAIAGVVVIIGVLIGFGFLLKKLNKEKFKKCVCSSREGGRSQNCIDTVEQDNLYADADRTEYTDQKSPGWDRGANPGNYEFPTGTCGGGSGKVRPPWGAWDFTEFGSQ